MSKALWVLHLSGEPKLLVKKGDKVSLGDELAKSEGKTFYSPAKAKVTKAEEDKIELSFETEKMEGKGLGQGHCWGEIVCSSGLNLIDLNREEYENKIVFIEEIEGAFANKAAALGVVAIITPRVREEKEYWPLLVLITEKEIESSLKKAQGKKCLLDVDNNCLLIPKE